MDDNLTKMLAALGAGLLIGGIAGFTVTRALSEKTPRTRDELMHRAQELNLRALRAPAA
jgi:hypothetical protein